MQLRVGRCRTVQREKRRVPFLPAFRRDHSFANMFINMTVVCNTMLDASASRQISNVAGPQLKIARVLGDGALRMKCLMQVNWAQGAEGQRQLQQIFTNSAALNGDAVVVFIRAVCAVSQEELVPTTSDLPPRYSHECVATHKQSHAFRAACLWFKL